MTPMRALNNSRRLLRRSLREFSADKAPLMGAALAFYTVFSIAPLLVIAIGVAGLVFGERGGEDIFEAISGLIGHQGAEAIEAMVRGAGRRRGGGWIATLLGVAALALGSSRVFGQLQESLNIVWKVGPRPDAGLWKTIRKRLWSFGMVVVIAFLLLVSMVVSAAISAFSELLGGAIPGSEALWQWLNALVSLCIIGALFAAIFKVLPDVLLRWRDVWVGGFFTALLFTVGKTLIGLYLGHSGVGSSYGAVGSLVIVLLWVYYSSQILLFGAEFTRVHALSKGRPIEPAPGAQLVAAPFAKAYAADGSDGRRPPRFVVGMGAAALAAGSFGLGVIAGRRAILRSQGRGARRGPPARG